MKAPYKQLQYYVLMYNKALYLVAKIAIMPCLPCPLRKQTLLCVGALYMAEPMKRMLLEDRGTNILMRIKMRKLIPEPS